MDSLRSVLNHVHALGRSRMSCGRNLLELTTYDKVTMWWFLKLRFCSIFYSTRNGSLDEKISLKYVALTRFYGFSEPFLDGLAWLALIFLIRVYQGDKRSLKKCPTILVTSQDLEWRDICDYDRKVIRRSDAFFDGILERLSQRGDFNIVGVYPVSPSMKSLKIFIDKQKNWRFTQKPFNIYCTAQIIAKARDARKHFKSLWTQISRDPLRQEAFRFDGLELYDRIDDLLRYLFTVVIPYDYKFIKMAEKMIADESPDLILIENEYGEFQKALIAAAKKNKIPTVAVQHGLFSSSECGYVFDPADKNTVLLPDLTCVFGQYYSDILVQGSVYDRSQVVVTGQPRYDILFHAKRIFSRDTFLKKHGIDVHCKILLWTTQCHAMSDDANMQSFHMVFKALESLKDVTLIVKQHPSEGEKYTRMIKECSKRYRASVIVTPRESNTYEQIFICDLLIAKHSTTAMEAVALDKPVIILNLEGEPDIGGYVTAGVAVGVSEGDDLAAAIEKLLKDDSELEKNRAAYIEKYLYAIDGKATERVADLIIGIINKHLFGFDQAEEEIHLLG